MGRALAHAGRVVGGRCSHRCRARVGATLDRIHDAARVAAARDGSRHHGRGAWYPALLESARSALDCPAYREETSGPQRRVAHRGSATARSCEGTGVLAVSGSTGSHRSQPGAGLARLGADLPVRRLDRHPVASPRLFHLRSFGSPRHPHHGRVAQVGGVRRHQRDAWRHQRGERRIARGSRPLRHQASLSR